MFVATATIDKAYQATVPPFDTTISTCNIRYFTMYR